MLQRFSFGTDLFNILKFNNNIKSYQPLLPLFITLIFITLFFIKASVELKISIIFTFVLFIQILICLDIIKYLNNIKKIFFTLVIINLANLSFALGSLLSIFGINNSLIRMIYIKSRNNK